MKKKRMSFIFLVTIMIILMSCFIITKNLTSTSYGKIDTVFGVISRIEEIFNPFSPKGKPISQIRVVLHNNSTIFSSKPISFSNIKDMNIKTASNQIPVRIYTPSDDSGLPMIIYSHGGGWVGGSIDDYEGLCRKLSKNLNAVVISVDYRLAPEYPFPAGINDVYNVLQWVYKNAKSINGDSSRICVAGDSAGGNISAVVAQMSRDKDGPHITSQVLIYPSTNIYQLNTKSWSYFGNDFSLTSNSSEDFIFLYTPKAEDRKSAYASPILAKDFRNLPDTLIITAEIDPLRDEGKSYGDKLKYAGVNVIISQYTGVTHGFITMEKITKKSGEAINEISTYLQVEFNKKKY